MTAVEIKVGVVDTPREITVESDETAEAITKAVSSAIDKGTLLSLTDSKALCRSNDRELTHLQLTEVHHVPEGS